MRHASAWLGRSLDSYISRRGLALVVEPRPVTGQREYRLHLFAQGAEAVTLRARFEAALMEAEALVAPEDETVLLAEWLLDDGSEIPPVWRARVRLAQNADGVTVDLAAQRDPVDLHDVLPPPAILGALWAPLAGLRVTVATGEIQPAVMEVTWQRFQAFFDNILLSPWRRLPLVVLTPGRHGDADAARRLAADLCGVVHVVRFDQQSTFRLSDAVGKDRSVYGGAVRIYRPGFTAKSDPLDHDLMVANYLDTRLLGGRPLSGEIARRVLPVMEEALPHVVHPEPAQRAEPEHVTRTRGLEQALAAAEAERNRLRAEVEHVRAELEALQRRYEALLARTPHVEHPAIPWRLQNPRQCEVRFDPIFLDHVASVARDGSLAAEVARKMQAVVLDPTTYGKPMRGVRQGQRVTYVARNYRLVWAMAGDAVHFLLCISKEDPEYSPHGA